MAGADKPTTLVGVKGGGEGSRLQRELNGIG